MVQQDIRHDVKRFKSFVVNSVQLIRNHSDLDHWKHF